MSRNLTQKLNALEQSALERRREVYLQEMVESQSAAIDYVDNLPANVQKRVKTKVQGIKHGMHVVSPLTCFGPARCPFYSQCPIPDRDKHGEVVNENEDHYPLNSACILEGPFMVQKVADYVLYLQVDPQNPVEMSIVNELALIDLLKNRGMLILSSGDKQTQGRDLMHVDESTIGFSENGTPLTSTATKMHPILEFIDRLERRRDRWLERLIETRQSKTQWAAKMGEHQVDSQILTELLSVKKHLEQLSTTEQQLVPLDDDDEESFTP